MTSYENMCTNIKIQGKFNFNSTSVYCDEWGSGAINDILNFYCYCLTTNYRRVPIIARQNSNRHNSTKSTSQV